MLERLLAWRAALIRAVAAWLEPLRGGPIGVLLDALKSFSRVRANEAAAGLAFYAVFSLFPLMGVLVAVLSFFLPQGQILRVLLDLLLPVFPASRSLISDNLARFIHLRVGFSIVGTLTLLWSASNSFTLLVRNIDQAWEKARVRTFWQNRLMALLLVAGAVVLAIALLLLTTTVDLFAQMDLFGFGAAKLPNTPFWRVLVLVVPVVILFIVLFVLYRWVPNTGVHRSEALWAAAVVTGLWQATSGLYYWYTISGVGNYDVLYGSLATIAVLMLWFYINSVVLLFGAHLSAAIQQHRQRRQELRMRRERD